MLATFELHGGLVLILIMKAMMLESIFHWILFQKNDVKKMHKAQLVINGSLAADAVEYIDITFGPLSSKKVCATLVLPINKLHPFWTVSKVYKELIPTTYKEGELKMVFNSIMFQCDAITGVMKNLREWKKITSKSPK